MLDFQLKRNYRLKKWPYGRIRELQKNLALRKFIWIESLLNLIQNITIFKTNVGEKINLS